MINRYSSINLFCFWVSCCFAIGLPHLLIHYRINITNQGRNVDKNRPGFLGPGRQHFKIIVESLKFRRLKIAYSIPKAVRKL